MNKIKIKSFIIVIMLISMIFSNIPMITAASDASNPKLQETLAVTLVIDNSGSMKKTDPEHLRQTAANIFIDLLTPEDYISVITFNTKQKVIIPMQQIKTSSNKAGFKSILSKSIDESGDTDYLGALNEAGRQLDFMKKGNVRKVILFLTDGEPDPDGSSVINPNYMNSLWKSVSALALKKYSVYSVGFSEGVNPDVLKRISEETQGSLKITDDSSKIALSFFDILGNLKNRNQFINETIELSGNKSLGFILDDYTTQATMVFTSSDGKPFDLKLTAPESRDPGSNAVINKYDKYSIVTINQGNKKLAGKWSINLSGSGNITAFGNKDLIIKPWLKSPEANSLHPLNEPIEISINLTGEVKQGLSAEAVITKDGVKDKLPVKLTLKDRTFTGVYKNADKPGEYDIDIKLMMNGQVITENTAPFTVRELPSIFTDFVIRDSKFKLGDSLIVTSSLNLKGSRLIDGDNIKIDNYTLFISYKNSGSVSIPLSDNGSLQSQDVKENDGIWSNKILFDKADSGNASIIVNGTYNGEKFLLEKPLGSFNVYALGKIMIKPLNTDIYTSLNKKMKISFEIENTSDFTENIIISIDKSIGSLSQNSIRIGPHKKIKAYVYVNLNKNLKNKTYNLAVKLNGEDEKVKIEPSQFSVKINILSGTAYILRTIKGIMIPAILILGILAIIILLVVMLGSFLYKKLVYENTILQGGLVYFKESDSVFKEINKMNFNKLGKGKAIISFNKDSRNADFRIYNTEYNYDIEISVILEKSRWKFMDGYKALLHKKIFSGVMLRTTEPGIFTYGDKIFTSRKIYINDVFITGGYVFQYVFGRKAKHMENDKGKNLLE